MENGVCCDVVRRIGCSKWLAEENSLLGACEKTGAASSVHEIFCGAGIGLHFRDRHFSDMDTASTIAVIVVVAAAARSGKNLAPLSGEFAIDRRQHIFR